jgi:hypothetical protein
MKCYQCLVCGWIYDEQLGWPQEGIARVRHGEMSPRTGAVLTVGYLKLTSIWSRFKQ